MAYESWTVDGLPLSTVAYDIETYDGLDDVPDLIFEDVPRAQGHGVDVGAHYFGPGRKAVSMMVSTTRPNGTTASTEDGRRAIFDANLDTLLRIFYRRKLLDVQRTLADGSVRRAWCRTVAGIKPQVVGLSAGRMTFDLQLPYSFWEDVNDVTTGLQNAGTNITLSAFAAATAPMDELEFDMFGPYNNPRLTDPETGSWVQVNGNSNAYGTGNIILVNKTQTVVGPSYNNVTHSGDPKWLTLYPAPGGPKITYVPGATGGTFQVRGKRKYLR